MVMVVVVVVLRRRVVVVMVVMVALDVGVGEQEGGRGGRRVLDRGHARRQRSVALDGAVPAGHAQLGGGGEETGGWDKKREKSSICGGQGGLYVCRASVCAHLARSGLLLLDRSSSLS